MKYGAQIKAYEPGPSGAIRTMNVTVDAFSRSDAREKALQAVRNAGCAMIQDITLWMEKD